MPSSMTPFKEKRDILKKHINKTLHNYKSILSGHSDIVCAIDINGFFVQTNTSFENLTGFNESELQKMTLEMLLDYKNKDRVLYKFNLALEGTLQNYDCTINHKDGHQIEVNFTNIPVVVDDEIVGLYGIGKDITDLKKNKEKIKEQEEIYRILTDNSLDIISRTDSYGRFLYVSPACTQILGYSSEELVGTKCVDLVHKDDQQNAQQKQNNVLNGSFSSDIYRVKRKDLTYIWVESRCKPVLDPVTKKVKEIITVTRDITERKKAEEEINNSAESYANLVEYSPDAIIIVKDSNIHYINDTGVDLFAATTKQQFLNSKIIKFLEPESVEYFQGFMNDIHQGEPVKFIEQNFIKMDGTTLEAEVIGIPTIFQNQPASHLIIRDTSQRKQTQQLLLKSEKLSVAGQLAAGIAHEIRNPLTSIKGFLQLMEMKSKDDSLYLDIVSSEIDRIELILSELLTLSKPQETRFTQSNLIQILENVKMLIETQANMSNIQINTLYDADISTINCDINQIKQVFINFVKNSIEAMPNGGEITIEVRNHGVDKVKLLFIDQGTGIPKHLIKRIGEPFFTTKEKGTGLGLMVSKQIIENHHGSLHLWSDKCGTIIEVILPIN